MPAFFQPAVAPVAPPSYMFNPMQQQQQQQYQPPVQQQFPSSYIQQQHQQQQQPQQHFNPEPLVPTLPPPAPIAQVAAAPIEKGPIRPENQLIQSVFDGLLNKCMQITNAPAAKRKLEDVSKKLDVLYDKLRSTGETAVSYFIILR